MANEVEDTPTQTPRERTLVRVLFVLVVFLVTVPLVVKGLGEEPYPTPLMPSFVRSPIAAGQLEWSVPTAEAVLADGRRVELSREELLPEIGVSRAAVIRSAFVIGLDDEGELIRIEPPPTLVQRLVLGVPEGTTLQGTAKAHDERTVRWLRSRMAEVLPGADVVEVQFTVERRRARPESLHDAEILNRGVTTVVLDEQQSAP